MAAEDLHLAPGQPESILPRCGSGAARNPAHPLAAHLLAQRRGRGCSPQPVEDIESSQSRRRIAIGQCARLLIGTAQGLPCARRTPPIAPDLKQEGGGGPAGCRDLLAGPPAPEAELAGMPAVTMADRELVDRRRRRALRDRPRDRRVCPAERAGARRCSVSVCKARRGFTMLLAAPGSPRRACRRPKATSAMIRLMAATRLPCQKERSRSHPPRSTAPDAAASWQARRACNARHDPDRNRRNKRAPRRDDARLPQIDIARHRTSQDSDAPGR